MSEQDEAAIDHRLKAEGELFDEYQRLREHLAVFWMYRPRNHAFMDYPAPICELSRRVEFLEEILQIPESDRFDYEEVDQREI